MNSALRFVAVFISAFALFLYSSNQSDVGRALAGDAASLSRRILSVPGGEGTVSYFRRRLVLDGEVDRAWVSVRSSGGFVLYVNGDAVLKDEYWRPTRPAGNGLSAWGQRSFMDEPAIALNFPREFQWGDDDGVSIAPLADLTPYLIQGENVISVVAESRDANPYIAVEGEVRLLGAEVLELSSEQYWEAASAPLDVSSPSWILGFGGSEKVEGGLREDLSFGAPLYLASPGAFREPFKSLWITAPLSKGEGSIRFKGEWLVEGDPDEAWVRVLSNRPYQLFVNGVRHRASSRRAPSHSSGEWIFSASVTGDVLARPRPTDPDEVMSPFELSRRNDEGRWRPLLGLQLDHATVAGTEPRVVTALRERSHDNIGRHVEEHLGRLQRPYVKGVIGGDEVESPVASFSAHDVGSLVVPGVNAVEVLVFAVSRNELVTDEVGIAVDCMAVDGSSSVYRASSTSAWDASSAGGDDRVAAQKGSPGSFSSSVQLEWLPMQGKEFHSVSARGYGVYGLALLIFAWGLSFLLVFKFRRLGGRHQALETLALRSLVILCVPASLCLLSVSLAELPEGVIFLSGPPWHISSFVCILAPLISWIPGRTPFRRSAYGRPAVLSPGGKYWPVAIMGLSGLVLLLRLWAVGGQPLDDDEYASYQAILAIVDSGVPSLDSGVVIYTRGPLYHYLVAAFVWVLGDDVWVFRLPSALFSVATGLLIYHIGSKYSRSRWIGLFSLFIFAVHPYCVFTGHVARFYQQQQFFSLLSSYFLVEGFVRRGNYSARAFCVASSIAAVLTQEISVILGAQIAVAFVVFRGSRPLSRDFSALLVAAVGGYLVALDYAAFKVLCQTLTEGVSANVEARLGPNLTKLSNLTSILFGYSRLHVVGSLFLLPSLYWSARASSRRWLGIHYVFWSGVILANIGITHVSLRYQYWLVPLWILIALHGLLVFSVGMSRIFASASVPRRLLASQSFCAGVLLIFISFAPWRIPSSYSLSLLGDSTQALRYVGGNLLPDDRVFVTEPHSHAALAEAGRIDGYLSFPLLHDFHVSVDGIMVDRNGGAPVISDLGSLQAQFAFPGRIWIAVNREKWRGRSKNLRWEYPGARAELFIRENCTLEHQSYLWDVFLWDPARGHFQRFDVAMK